MRERIFNIMWNCFKPTKGVSSLDPWSLGILKSYSDYYDKEMR